MMRLKFKNSKLLVRASKRLVQILNDIVPDGVDFHFKNATAYVAGYRDWEELLRLGVDENMAIGELSVLDEGCDPGTLTLRREYQAARLSRFCELYDVVLGNASLALVNAWRPSAGRPQEETEAFNDRDRLMDEGEAERCWRILHDVERHHRIPAKDEVETIIRGLRLFSGEAAEYVMTYIGPLAARLVNRQIEPAAGYGVRLLEALVANGFPYPVVSLARALRNGWGTPEDHPRAWSLLSKALQDDMEDQQLYIERSSYVEMYSLAGFLLMHGTNCRHDRARALELYTRASELGDGPAALFVTQFYMPLPATGPDEYWGVVPPNQAKAEYWFMRAIQAGYNPHSKSFPEGVISKMSALRN